MKRIAQTLMLTATILLFSLAAYAQPAAGNGVTSQPALGETERAAGMKIYSEVAALIDQAKAKNIDVLYFQAAAIPMRAGLNERWNAFPNDRPATMDYVKTRGADLIAEIKDVLSGKKQARQVPPKPDFEKMKLKGRNFYQGEEPKLIASVHSGPSAEAQAFFVPHREWVYTCMAPGADRFTYKNMPIWEAYQKYPDVKRVWGGGWCGHIIADKWSGGVQNADCVICLESPHTREACVEGYKIMLPPAMKSKTRQVSLLDYEYTYLCFCDITKDMFRKWCKDKFGTIEKLNDAWQTKLTNFDEIALPEMKIREKNDAKRYDWYDFNIWRFTDFMIWAKAQQRKIDPDIPMATCAPHSNFTKDWGESGSDVEMMANNVNDFCINESPSSTKFVDFLRSISDNKKAIIEVEGSEYRNSMASYLHGLSALSLYWAWDSAPTDGGAMLYGRGQRPAFCSLAETERFLRTALDIRRLGKEIIAFQDVKSPVALLYSRASMLQTPAVGGDKTPYLLELEHTYDALMETGVSTDFITTKQVLEGKLSQYKVLVIPAATYEHAEVVAKVMDFARAGGQVVLVPNSWFFDQYNRPQNYLEQLKIKVVSMKAPVIKAGAAKTGIQRDISGEETEAPFLMGLIVDTVVSDVPKAKIKADKGGIFAQAMELQGAGVQHVLAVGPGDKVLAKFEQGQPAIVEVAVDKGSVYYLGIPLVKESMVELMTDVIAKTGSASQIKFLTPDGKNVPGLEYHVIKTDGGYLAYVNNLDRDNAKQLKLTSDIKFTGISNLTLDSDLPTSFTLPAEETFILKLKQ